MPRGRPRVVIAPCSSCQKKFKRKEHLRRYERIHTKEKPFACQLCDEIFSRQDLVLRHTRISHIDHTEPVDAPLEEDEATQGTPSHCNESADLFGNNTALGVTLDDLAEAASSTIALSHQLQQPIPTTEEYIDPSKNYYTQKTIAQPSLNGFGPATPERNTHTTGAGTPVELFAHIDSFDWLWENNESNSYYLPTSFLDNDISTVSGINEGTHSLIHINDRHVSSWLRSDTIPISGLNVGFRWPRVPPRPANQYQNTIEIVDNISNSNLATNESISVGQGEESRNQHRIQTGTAGPLNNTLHKEGESRSPTTYPWRICKDDYDRVKSHISQNISILPTKFNLPSHNTLSRYLEGYFTGFQEHVPFLYLPSLCLKDLPEHLLLSLAALGSLYKFEPESGYELYSAAKVLVYLRPQGSGLAEPTDFQDQLLLSSDHTPASEISNASPSTNSTTLHSSTTAHQRLRLIQSFIALTAMASWGQGRLVSDSLGLASQLVLLCRAAGIAVADSMPPDLSWEEWIAREERRRTLLVAYTLANMQSVAFNIPPALTIQDIQLCLPRPAVLWQATTPSEWENAHSFSAHGERSFRGLLSDLLSGRQISNPSQISIFGTFILVHGLIQHIFMERQIANGINPTSCLQEQVLASLSHALKAWQKCWSSVFQSTFDPVLTNGPLAFNPTALLRIAYIRIAVDLGPYRSVITRNARQLANTIGRVPVTILSRTSHADLAVLQCIHALGILVRAGVAFVRHTHPQNWTIIHSLSNMECACFLSLWLRNIATLIQQHGASSPRDRERKLLGMITSIMTETKFEDVLDQEPSVVVKVRKLAVFTVRIWADAIRGDHIYGMVQTIADGMVLAADDLESQLLT